MNPEKNVHKKYYSLFDVILDDVVTLASIMYFIVLIAELHFASELSVHMSLIVVDTIICFLFLFEFFYFLLKSDNKLTYFKHNFLDLIASIPYVLLFSVSGFFFLFNFFKVIRGLKSVVRLYELIFKIGIPILLKILLLFMIIISFFAIMIVEVESKYNPGIQTFGDGIWWAIVTIATVGYGDVVPITIGGKVLTFFLVFCGMGLTSSIGGLFVVHLLKPKDIERKYDKKLNSIKREEDTIKKEEDDIKQEEDSIKNEEDTIAYNENNITNLESHIMTRIDKLEKKMISKKNGKLKKITSQKKLKKVMTRKNKKK
ncbi:MAG: ion transporter [Candidatus Woesearchaeota archaeon]